MTTRHYVNIAGQRFGSLTALTTAGNYRRRNGRRGVMLWRCRCDCGKRVVARSDALRRGKKTTCGIDGHTGWSEKLPLSRLHPLEYATWNGMRKRCSAKKGNHWKYYGSRGIKVCERWKKFSQFLQDVGPRPSPRHSIDRYPNQDGNYEPGNVRWATVEEQRRNNRDAIYVEFKGESVALGELVEKLGLNHPVVYGRLKMGWSLADALTIPVRPKRKNRKRAEELPP